MKEWKPPITVFRKCDYDGVLGRKCGRAKWRRQNTRYEDDRKNWVYACDECFKEIESHWEEMWSDYWAGRL